MPFFHQPQPAPAPVYAAPQPARLPQPAPTAKSGTLWSRAEPPRPKFRMHAPDPPVALEAKRLVLPPPENLGVVAQQASTPQKRVSASPAVDWASLGARLKDLRPISFRLDNLGTSGYRVIMLLPGVSADAPRHIETIADTDAAAVQMALQRAESHRQ